MNSTSANIPSVLNSVVDPGLCVGCGLCSKVCPQNALDIKWSINGFLEPYQINDCDMSGECIQVCPFDPMPQNDIRTEDELSRLFLESAVNHNERIGAYSQLFVGSSNEHRLSSSSGGMATHILISLLKEGIVQHVISVKEASDKSYEYSLSSSVEQLKKGAKTRYFPVTLASALDSVYKVEGKVAVVGIGCFLKALRKAQYRDEVLKDKVVFTVGIICGGLKSRFFTEFLSENTGVQRNHYKYPQYRVKDLDSHAGDYGYSCKDTTKDGEFSMKMKTVGDMWGTGMFKCKACDFCDDVTTELADVSVGDAWIPPYVKDGRGTNIVIARSSLAAKILEEEQKQGRVSLEEISLETLLESQRGSFSHRQKSMKFRVNLLKRKVGTYPVKRERLFEKIGIEFKIVQICRMYTRRMSLKNWRRSENLQEFNKRMKMPLKLLSFATRIYHLKRRFLD